jgi:hypothetical protein
MQGMERVSLRSVGLMKSRNIQLEYCVLRSLGQGDAVRRPKRSRVIRIVDREVMKSRIDV